LPFALYVRKDNRDPRLVKLVAMGISLIPRMAMLKAGERVQYRLLKNQQPRRTIAIIWRRRCPHKKGVLEFLKHLREVGKTFQQSSEKPKA